ncbi:unnamed protein product [Trifolium pratense]|uniref:Uncharacterized protein n=1 Tax=Trifolium pratense TaxID=57577 RepID=A0ACB0JU84_TRIPR|nr:unnamed protein product [Trifolium pratense]
MKFVYIMTLFLSLSLVAANFDHYYECHTDVQCEKIVKCKLPAISYCRNYKCICDTPRRTLRKSMNARPKRVQISYMV